MRIYPHWLEGTTRRNAIRLSGNPHWRPDDYAEYLLKLHAFFGTTIALSEVEIVDSPVLWRLFSNPEFKYFLRSPAGEDYLELRCFTRDYRGVYPASASIEWNLATEGLKAAILHAKIETPEIHDHARHLRRLEQLISAGPDPDFDRLLYAWRREPSTETDQRLTAGLVEAVRFFSRKGAPTHSIEARGSYDQVLSRARDSARLTGPPLQHVERVIKLIEQRLPDPEARKRRTNIGRLLDLNDPFEREAWVTINQGWSVSVQESVALGGHMAHYGVGVEIGMYVQEPADSLVRMPDSVDVPSSVVPAAEHRVIRWTFDPGELSWRELGQLMTETMVERQNLQRALAVGDDEPIYETLKSLSRAAANAMAHLGHRPQPLVTSQSRLAWLIAGYVIGFGNDPTATAVTAAALHEMLRRGDEARVAVMGGIRKHAVTTRIQNVAETVLGTPKKSDGR